MSKNLLIMISLCTYFLTSCVSAIPYSYQEQCAFRGMKLAGVRTSEGSSKAYNYNFGATTIHNSEESVNCEVLESEEEQQRTKEIVATALPKVHFNDTVDAKALLNGVGYLFYILPGMGLYLIFNKQRDKAIAESREISATIKSLKSLDKP